MTEVIHIVVGLEIGGAELMLKRLVLECAQDQTYKQTVISLTESGAVGEALRSEGINVVQMNMRSILGLPVVIYKLVQILKARQPNAVFTWMYHADLIGGIAAYISGVRNIIWGVRNTQIPQSTISSTGLIIKLCAFLSYFIPRIIVCNAHAGRDGHVKLGYCDKKMIVISNGYDLKLFQPTPELQKAVRKKLGIIETAKIVGVVGRYDELKDYHNFVKAISRVTDRIDNGYFFMVGKGLTKENDELMSWIYAAKVEDKVILFGQVNPHDLYAAMDFYCLASKAEGFPNVVAEAMAMETPCIVTDVGDAKIIVGDHGKVVPPSDPRQLADAIIEMLEMTDDRAREMGIAARASIIERYSISKISQEYIQLSCYVKDKE